MWLRVLGGSHGFLSHGNSWMVGVNNFLNQPGNLGSFGRGRCLYSKTFFFCKGFQKKRYFYGVPGGRSFALPPHKFKCLDVNSCQLCPESFTQNSTQSAFFRRLRKKPHLDRCGPLPIMVTTRIITFLVGDSYKASFATVAGRGPRPKDSVDGSEIPLTT